jgi:hypothetical protein
MRWSGVCENPLIAQAESTHSGRVIHEGVRDPAARLQADPGGGAYTLVLAHSRHSSPLLAGATRSFPAPHRSPRRKTSKTH